MAKKTNNATPVVEDEKTTEVEKTETTVEVETTKAVEKNQPEEKPAEKAKDKPIKDDDKIIIVCAAYAGKSIVLPTRTIQLDEKGCCEVTGIEAKRLLSIPGYERK